MMEVANLIKTHCSHTLVAHAYSPGYSGGRDQEDHGSKPAQAKFARPFLKKTHHKNGLVEWLKV
jgi:hypothetical protein